MMQIAFYCAHHPKARMLARLTDWLSRPSARGGKGFSHVELVFSDGVCISSSAFDPVVVDGEKVAPNGVRFKSIDFSAHPDNWVLMSLPSIPVGQEYAMRMFASALVRKPCEYDFGGVMRFVWPWSKEHDCKYFCSEVVAHLLRLGTTLLPPVDPPDWKISPNWLAQHFGARAA